MAISVACEEWFLSSCESKLNYILARTPCMEAYQQLISASVAKQHDLPFSLSYSHRMYFGCHTKVLYFIFPFFRPAENLNDVFPYFSHLPCWFVQALGSCGRVILCSPYKCTVEMPRYDMEFFLRLGKIYIWTEPKVWLEDAGGERPRWLEKPTVGYVQQV